ncbi:MAG TPA: hypothetical protein VFM99_08350 [Chitinophagales bacterium]|nr:hypothetical protein [Chitinophagales bacterium]
MKRLAHKAGAIARMQPATQVKESCPNGMPLQVYINTTPAK